MIRAAVYCRVSTDSEDQANSFESQKRYFSEYIDRQEAMELYEIYADDGITGTSTKKREAFKQMMADARLHMFDLIITKEVSRFSRNILDTISYTRELRNIGIGVIFVNDGINSLEPDAELRLSIMGSIAQEESRKTSERVKWGQTRRMEEGVVFGHSMLGYDVCDGKLFIEPEGAKLVRLIFQKYVCEHKGTTIIARELQAAGYKTKNGSTNWRGTTILKILRNEKYCGDLKQKKTITTDYLTHRKKYNRGEEEFVFIKNHHEPIVERSIWEEAQREIIRRDTSGKTETGHGNRYALSGKIICSKCGKNYVSRSRRRQDKETYRVWRCGTVTLYGKKSTDKAGNETGCTAGYQIYDSAGIEIIKKSVGMLKLDREVMISDILYIVEKALEQANDNSRFRLNRLKKERDTAEKKKKGVFDAFFAGNIYEEDMKLMNEEYRQQICKLNNEIDAEKLNLVFFDKERFRASIREKIEKIIYGIDVPDILYGEILDHITAYPDRRLEVRLKYLPSKWIFSL